MRTATAGRAAEALAEKMLENAGLKILRRNFRCRHGEIDLIALDAETVVFCEVRLRSGERFGGAAESVTRTKQARIVAAASYFLAYRAQSPCRFDVLLMPSLDAARIRWIRNAFTP